MKLRPRLAALLLGLLLPLRPHAAETLPLAGEWRFAPDRADAGTEEKWFAKNLPDKIQLPGILESQGYGNKISTGTPWVLSLYDHYWFLRADYAAYTNAGSVKVPFLCQPPRHYLGAAWYQRDVEIPAGWSGRRVVLFLERPKWKSTVWLDDKEIGSEISLCTPHEFDFGRVPPGRHRLTVRVDNRMILPYRPDAHSISDSLDQAWNGIVGKMELRATPPVWIEDVQVFPNVSNRTALIKTTVGNLTGRTIWCSINVDASKPIPQKIGGTAVRVGHGSMISNGRELFQTETPISEGSGAVLTLSSNRTLVETQISFDTNATVWDEFHPLVCKIYVDLNMEPKVEFVANFGLRDIHTDGTQFILNGQPIYLRGTHFGGDFPLTGYPPTDVESWKKIFLTCKSYGLNSMRFHSWCPPEAAFEAADELGFYLYVEPGMWNTFNPGSATETMLYFETERIIKSYGNHPSFLMLSPSNEPKGRWQDVLPQWAAHFRAADPRRLYTSGTGFTDANAPGPLDRVDFTMTGRVGPRRVRGETGWFGRDYSRALEGIAVPAVAHELGQWCAYPDFEVINKFTGFMRPGNYEIFRDSAAAHGVLEQNHEFAQASGKFQFACYKEEIEANLRTPGLAGFQLLDLHDYTGQGTAPVGLLDPFWESKGYAAPDEFKKFCNAVVPLARLKQRVFTTADKFDVPVEVANFGEAPMSNYQAVWRIENTLGEVVAHGVFAENKPIPLGKNFPLGTVAIDLSALAPAKQYRLVVWAEPEWVGQIGGARTQIIFRNDWNFWLYPAAQPVTPPVPNFVETSSPAAAKQALADGKKVLFTPRLADLSWWSPPLARVPVFWNALMGPTWSRMLGLWCDTNSPALAEFPTDANCDWQWTEITGKSRAVNLDALPRGLKPIVSAIDDWNRNYKLGVIFEARVGSGKLLVCSADLNAAPVGPQLRRSLENYMAGEKFQPATEITAAQFDGLFFDNLVMRKLGARATADGKPANEIVDGDPNTFWCSADSKGNSPKPPHEIQISFPQPVAMSGLVLMPRQNHREHQGDIREYEISTSDDGTNWQTVRRSELASTFDPQTIAFGKIITAKFLKLAALSGFGSDKSAALAELAVLYAGPALPENGDKLEYHRTRTASTDIDAGGAPASPPKRRPKK